jgi:hypothetical protein
MLLNNLLIVTSVFVESIVLFAMWACERVPVVVRHAMICVAEPAIDFDGEFFPVRYSFVIVVIFFILKIG